MADLDILHFEQLKNEIQAQYLKNHTPSIDDISKWKGIDIIYFQEDLRKIAKGNISEKTFYTYFKTSNISKPPRIDMLNLLSIYAGYASWYDFKKNHLFANEILRENEASEEETDQENNKVPSQEYFRKQAENNSSKTLKNDDLQKNTHDLQQLNLKNSNSSPASVQNLIHKKSFIREYLWLGISAILAISVGLLAFKDQIFSKAYTYRFIDADRNTEIRDNLEIKILKGNGESPILFKLKPNEQFTYRTKSKSLKMVVSSTFYKVDTISRNLENASQDETIELQPNNYAQMLFYYSKSIKDLKKKREQLDKLISDNAIIYQVFDNDTYGVETIDKQRYITLVTLPTTSLENLKVIEIDNDGFGKISMIKFRIGQNEEKK